MMSSMKLFNHVEQNREDIFQAFLDKTEYVSEPGMELVKDSINDPVNKILHPMDTGSSIVKTVWATILRSSEVVNDGIDYIVKGPASKTESKKGSNSESKLEKRQQKAYSSAINNAIDQAIPDSPSEKNIGPNNHDDLEQLSRVGPALIRKLHEAGIYKFSQIANPTQQEKKALQEFESRGAFTTWKEETQQLITK